MQDLISPTGPDYQLLDSGEGEKLERIAGHLTIRPCPQAIWQKRRTEHPWQDALSICTRSSEGGGSWEHRRGNPKHLLFRWPHASLPTDLTLICRFTAFGHCGVFFEHCAIWDLVLAMKPQRVMNLFGYTGGASLACAASGCEVFHVDSAKGVLDWGKESQKLNPTLPGKVSWIHDDARASLAFSERKGFKYDAIIMDPPSWGHGKHKQQVWDFSADTVDLIRSASACLSTHGKLIFTCHTPGVQMNALLNIVHDSGMQVCQQGDMAVPHLDDKRLLPAGLYVVAQNA